MCGLRVETEDGRIVRVRPDADDVSSHGYVCPKGVALGELAEDPDRLTRPMKRAASGFVEIGWREALAEAAERLRAIRAAHGNRSVAMYIGNPAVHNTGLLLGGDLLRRSLHTISRFSASTVDQVPKQLSSWLLYGHQFLFPLPDVDRTELFVILGANPLASNGSLLSAPGIRKRLRGIRDRGGRVVLIDPRRTETAKVADTHHFVRPATDAFVLAAIARELLADPAPTALPVEGHERLAGFLAPFTPEAAAARSGMSADAIRALAADLRSASRAVVYGRIGTCTQRWGTVSSWLVDVVNLLAGHLDTEGGILFAEPAIDLIAAGLIGPGSRGRWASRVRGLPEVMGELPVATLAEEITEPGEERVRALVTLAGNPVLSTPGAGRLDAALGELEFMVSVDPYLNETTRHADLILPPATSLASGHYDLVFHHLAVRTVAKWSDPVLPMPEGGRSDFDILSDLAVRIGRGRGPLRKRLRARVLRAIGEAQVVDWLLRFGRYGSRSPHKLSLRKLRKHPHGIDLGPLKPSLARRLRVPAIDLAPALIAGELQALAADLETAPPRLVLIGRRHLRSNNSWMHNVASLVKGRDRCTLLVHPDDAEAFGLVDGGTARVKSEVGEVVAPVEVSDEIMPGVVSLPHGWGHDRDDTRMRVAREHAGVNVNLLTDPAVLDGPSGNAVLNGVPVQIGDRRGQEVSAYLEKPVVEQLSGGVR